ncbi:MAG: DUF4149 domain-containing protein [Gammaproteobacteria bacterium]|nr:DUF4149 domain-containing protein [Gammaproteobacteria bacterium]
MKPAAVLPAIERVLLALWVGGLWTTGFVLAPVLFSDYPRSVAGEIAGRLFQAVSVLGIACAAGLLLLAAFRVRRRVWRDARTMALAAMLAITVFGEFGIAAELRRTRAAAMEAAPGSELRAAFGRLHGYAGALYFVNALLGLALVVAGSRRDQAGS